MNFNKEEFDKFRKSMKEAVKKVEEEFNVEIDFGNISYKDKEFTIKTTVYNDTIEERRKSEYLSYCGIYGLEEADFGKEFMFKGKKTWIIGFDPKRRKFPIIVKDEAGREFLITIDGVKQCLGKA